LNLTSVSQNIKNKFGEIFLRLLFTFYVTRVFKRNPLCFQKNLSKTTNWIDISENDQLSSQYNIPWNQSNIIKDPSLRAKLILESWINIDNESKNIFFNILTKLLRIAHLLDDKVEMDQEVSDTVYVMY